MATEEKAAKEAPAGKSALRIDLLIEAQQKVVENLGKFFEHAADMTMKGVYSPSDWIKCYAEMWRNLAADLADVTKKM